MKIWCLVFSLAWIASAGAQVAIDAAIARKNAPPSPERIVSADPTGVNILMPDGRSLIKLPYDQIEEVRFAPPSGWDEIARLIKVGKVAEAEGKMLPIATRMAQLTVIKGGNAGKYVFAYTDVLRSLGKYQAALDFLEKAPFPPDAPVVDRARRLIVMAYCQAMLGQVDEAEKMLNQVEAPGSKSYLFTIYLLARARVEAQRKDPIAALDDIARIVALKRLGSESYDEALYQSAEAYDALGRILAEQKQVVEKDARLDRQMRQDNLDAIARFDLIKSDPLQVAAVWDAGDDYARCATAARLQLCRVYPTSPWTVKAREKLPAEAREILGGDLADKPAPETAQPTKPAGEKPAPKSDVLQLDSTTEEKDGR